MNTINYQKELEKILNSIEKGKKLFLHSCCAPCSSYVLEYLRVYFQITVFYYNPNISENHEYQKRVEEQMCLIRHMNNNGTGYKIEMIEGIYEPKEFYEIAQGLEHAPEGGERCAKCFQLRLEMAAKMAKFYHADYFATTLTISPLKNAPLINEIGKLYEDKYGVEWLYSDFKKKNGYKRSVELSQIGRASCRERVLSLV